MGGEEFAILLPETNLSDAGQLAERLRENLAKMQISVGNSSRVATEIESSNNDPGSKETSPQVSLTASIGVSLWHGGSDSLEALLQRADTCLYEAKDRGRNQVVICELPAKSVMS
jgi:PleD family two-component response regulator